MINIAIVTGGDSLESDSSFKSAFNVFDALREGQYCRYVISLNNWQWRLLKGDGISESDSAQAVFDPVDFSFVIPEDGRKIQFDAAFITIHGAPAETGHLQGYLELAGMPYTGSGVLASSLAMNKYACKCVLSRLPSLAFAADCYFQEASESLAAKVTAALGFPCIVKPNSYGSGIGVALVSNRPALDEAVKRIEGLGQGILAEEFVAGRELTVGAVIVDQQEISLPVAEVFRPENSSALRKTGASMFTNRQSADIRLDPPLDVETMRLCRDMTIAVGKALNCRHHYRVDYILASDNSLYFLEVNTVPGMAPDSVFTRQIGASELSEGYLYEMIIGDALKDRNT